MSKGYLFGRSFTSDSGQKGGQYFQIARVKSVVLGPFKGGTQEVDPDYRTAADIGKVRYELLYSPIGTSFSQEVSEPAWPFWGYVKQYPVINEVILIMAGPTPDLNDNYSNQRRFYLPTYAIWGDANHNAFPNLKEYSKYLKNFASTPGYSGDTVSGSTLPLGYTFQENPNIKNLKPFEGDSILQARFGQSIRFGSTVTQQKSENTWSNSGTNGDPITLIVNKQGNRINTSGIGKFNPIVEDINEDGSSIYLTSTQEIFLEDINNFPLKSFGVGIDPQRQPVYELRKPIVVPSELASDSDIDNQILNNA